MIVDTGDYTGRSPKDKFVVREPTSEKDIWWGDINQPISQALFDRLLRKMLAYLQNRDIFVFDGHVGADPRPVTSRSLP
jgi:phosphoenolpyruvate carboxykinase (ATP)